MTDLLVDLNALLDGLGSSQAGSGPRSLAAVTAASTPPAASKGLPAWVWLLAGVPLGALAMWALWKPAAPASMLHNEYTLERVTWDGQFNGFPALSPDGTLLAFASDRDGDGDLDIWVKQVNGGALVRVTDDPADELQPSFSPDGSQLVFYRWGKGVFTVPTLGGEPYLVAEGASPVFAPDGKRIAYIKNDAPYVSPVSMGEPKQLLASLAAFGEPLWTPDGKHLLIAARIGSSKFDWWAIPEDGSEPRSLGARELYEKMGKTPPRLEGWSWLGDSLVFENGGGELTRIGFDFSALRVRGPEELITVGAGIEIQPSASREGAISFMNAWQRRDIWSLPLAGGDPVRLTTSESSDTGGDVSLNAKRMVYLSNRWGQRDIWAFNLETGEERNLTSDDAEQYHPVLSPDGERVAYLAHEEDKPAIYLRPFNGGVGRLVCADCGIPPTGLPTAEVLSSTA